MQMGYKAIIAAGECTHKHLITPRIHHIWFNT